MKRRATLRKIGALALLGLLAVPMMYGVLQLPAPGAADAPVQTGVSSNYFEGGPQLAGAENLVTAILLNFRALDTFGEVVVIFTAWLAVMAVATATPGRAGNAGKPKHDLGGEGDATPVSPIVDYVIRVLVPFIGAFALFIIVSGHMLPGGGFQGGVVFGALLILLTLILGPDTVIGALSASAWRWLRASAVLGFAAVALAGLVTSGHWFGLPESPDLREWLIVALELAIGVGAGTVLAGLFLAVSGSDSPEADSRESAARRNDSS